MPGPIQSIERAAAVLHFLGAVGEPVALADLSRAVDLAKPTVHGIVRTLCAVGFVEQHDASGRYSLSRGLATLGAGVDVHLLRSRAMNWADGLAAQSGLEVQLGVRAGEHVELVHHVFRPDGSDQLLRVGELQPLHATALGQVLLAFAPVAANLHALDLTGYTRSTLTDPDLLSRVVRRVRRQGWAAVDSELHPGVAAVAAPIRHHVGAGVVGALGVVGPRDRLLDASGAPTDGLELRVVESADAVSRQLQERL